MKTFDEANLANATQMYAVANTPLFLIRKLREDSAVFEIAASFSGSVIVDELKAILEREPRTAEDFVRPYVYLGALAQKPEDSFLRQALALPGRERWDWYEFVAGALWEMYMATAVQTIGPKNVLLSSCTASVAGTDAVTLLTIP